MGFDEKVEIGIGVLWIALHPNYDKVTFIDYITFCLDSWHRLTVGPWADVKNGFTWKIIIVLKVRGGNGELKFS